MVQRVLNWSEHKKELTVNVHTSSIINKYGVYDSYHQMLQHKKNLEANKKAIEDQLLEAEKSIEELKPYYEKIKDEVFGELKKKIREDEMKKVQSLKEKMEMVEDPIAEDGPKDKESH